MKFVGGPKHGEEVPSWARDGRAEVYLEGPSFKREDGTWEHPRLQYVRQTWTHRDGRQSPYYADSSMGQLEEIETAAQPLMDSTFPAS